MSIESQSGVYSGETTSSMRELHDEMYSIDHMYRKVESLIEEKNLKESRKALEMMCRYHEGQVRKGKERVPYIAHPLLMACHAFALEIDTDDLIATTLLHDVVEDCGVTVDELDVNDQIKEAVQLLTFEKLEGETKAQAKKRYFEAIRPNPIAGIVKLLDRTNNVSHMAVAFPKAKLESYIIETENLVFPLVDHIKHTYPEYYDAVFLLKYQMISVIETLKHVL